VARYNEMKTSTRNQAIAMLMIGILILLAFWWWSARTPTKTFNITQIAWNPPASLQVTLGSQADRKLYGGKTAIIQDFIPATTASADQQTLIMALKKYPFVISDDNPPGIDPSGFIVSIGSLPNKVPNLPAQTLIASTAPGALSTLRINLK
jgi:hypothetical protein